MKRILPFIFTFYFLLVTLPSAAFAESATLSLDPSSGTFNSGCTFSLNVNLDTGGVQTDGADAILVYDTAKFTATSITKGTIYPDYPGNNIDAASGKITISGLASVSTPFSGKGILATINFTVVTEAPAGVTQMTFDFDPNDKAKTTDSNVVERGTVTDILNSVVNGSYTIGTGTCGQNNTVVSTSRPSTSRPVGAIDISTPSATLAPTYIPVPVRKTLPEGGTQEVTFAIAIVGGILTVLGILGLALL